MALVTTIGIFVIASRVAGSRQSASSSSLSLAARQAAEFGFSEVIAEMNRDSKSYLWVTKFEEWNHVSAQDLKDCGVAAMADPAINPISSLGSERTLPNSPELSYRFKRYIEPAKEPKEPSLTPDPSAPAVPEVCNSKFGNLIGGTGEITIEGTFDRGSGYMSTFTLKRKVSLKRAAPIFNNPITAFPANRSFDPADSRFPPFPPIAPTGTPYYRIICEPEDVSFGGAGSRAVRAEDKGFLASSESAFTKAPTRTPNKRSRRFMSTRFKHKPPTCRISKGLAV
jgi:hypothetical protein